MDTTFQGGVHMPNMTIEAAHLSDECKEELIKELPKAASEITKIPVSSFTLLIKEFPVENWGIGGKSLKQVLSENSPES